MRKIDLIVIHCSATRCDRDYPVEQLRADHRMRGFREVGYHYYIRRNGTLHSCRPLEEMGAHARGWNAQSVGICYEGGLDTNGHPADTRTEEQRVVMQEVVTSLLKRFPESRVVGHRDLPGCGGKECPCFEVQDVIVVQKM